MNLFEKVKCKGFYKPFKDGRWLYLDRKTQWYWWEVDKNILFMQIMTQE